MQMEMNQPSNQISVSVIWPQAGSFLPWLVGRESVLGANGSRTAETGGRAELLYMLRI